MNEIDQLDYNLSIQDVLAAYLLALNLEEQEMWEHLEDYTILWSEDLRSAAIKRLHPDILSMLSQRVYIRLSLTLEESDCQELLKQLKAIRNCIDRSLMAMASQLLEAEKRTLLKKMVILQNIATGNKPSQKPWESKTRKPSPKRREPSEKTTRIKSLSSVN